ncbi:unnamed protein product [Sphenostylis stenocarpa]|uniref:Uncharacterized protein n=1 Tax=Sphenostylis stenocarpa TaxID=92480 RepID=A0AA86S1F5_9FABA|nr:unnamed protein product [Sphenostylis stenocarpa]
MFDSVSSGCGELISSIDFPLMGLPNTILEHGGTWPVTTYQDTIKSSECCTKDVQYPVGILFVLAMTELAE